MTPADELDLRPHGVLNPLRVRARLSPARLVEAALANGEGELSDTGCLVALTGPRTGRSPKDRFIVRDEFTDSEVDWGSVNLPMEPAAFRLLAAKVRAYLQHRDLFVTDGYVCADPAHRVNVRVVAEKAWHALFARCLFRRPSADEFPSFSPDWTVLAAPDLHADPAHDGTRTEAFVVLSFAERLVLIGGTHYAGEIKKSIFSALNFLLPQRGVFPMHCSANKGPAGDSALFFGLSGTGKTTLSADPERQLIGDDEHGWSDGGVFNLEGGCYAKTIKLTEAGEPQIYAAIRFGAVLENVPLDPLTRRPDFFSQRYTENTRVAYPVEFIPHFEPSGRGGHPKHVIFLTADAFGVLPPLSRLTIDQALYHFLSGYTAKVAGTEAGVTQPEATFSTCFGAPFLPLRPARYAALLRERLERHAVPVWLVNTGWTGGPAGVGKRFALPHTRAMLRAALNDELDGVEMATDPVFGLRVPRGCPGVPAEVLQPRLAWADGTAYDAAARKVAGLFRANFEKYTATTDAAVRAAGPVG